MMKRILTYMFLLTFAMGVMAQETRSIFRPEVYGVFSLGIAPDSRAGGMGDMGVATEADGNSEFWNPAKTPFNIARAGVAVSYTPWLRKIVGGINLAAVSGFYRIGDYSAISASMRFFSVGETTVDGTNGMTISPYEMSLSVAYSRMLSETFSMGVSLKFVLSDMGDSHQDSYHSAKAFAADISMYRSGYFFIGDREVNLAWGINLQNLGTKVNYGTSDRSDFLPTTLRLGLNLTVPINDFNRFSVGVETYKYLIPTFPVDENGDPIKDEGDQRVIDFYNTSSFSAIFKSFDAPDGFGEVMKTFRWVFGAEYTYNDRFSLRAGYHYENPQKGNRQYLTFGAGFRMSVFSIDASYLYSTAQGNPLDQTMRFTLGCDLDGLKDLFGRKR